MQQKVRIGTRGSPLALAQANEVKNRLIEANANLSEENIDIVTIKTTGDKILDRHLMYAGGKGLFTKEIEEALLRGDIDCAVHSTKDMPTSLPQGLELSTFLPREDPRDVFVSANYKYFNHLPIGATVGTASLRRRAQALKIRPDLNIVTLRGTVKTRIEKMKEGKVDATFLALAGLKRLGMEDFATNILPVETFTPAPSQGAICIEIRQSNKEMNKYLKPLNCEQTALIVNAERAFLQALDGSCRTPIACHAAIEDDCVLVIKGAIYSVDGQSCYQDERFCGLDQSIDSAKSMAETIRERAGEAFFEKLEQDIKETIN